MIGAMLRALRATRDSGLTPFPILSWESTDEVSPLLRAVVADLRMMPGRPARYQRLLEELAIRSGESDCDRAERVLRDIAEERTWLVNADRPADAWPLAGATTVWVTARSTGRPETTRHCSPCCPGWSITCVRDPN